MFKKKLLNKAIMATVLGGMMLAPSFALAGTAITGTSGQKITGVTVSTKSGQKNIKNTSTTYVSYAVSKDATIDGITLDGTKAYISGSKKSLTISNHSGAGEQVAVNVCNGGDLYTMTTNATNILTLNLGSITSTDGIAYGYKIKDSNGWIAGIRNITSVNGAAGAYGLYADNSWVTDYVSAAQLFKIGNKNDEGISYGVSSSANGSDKAAGIYADNNSQVLIQKLEEYVKGNGVVAKGGSKVALGSDKSGTVTVYVDKTNTDDYAALLADGDSSQIDVGLKDTWKTGTFTFGAISNGYQDNINGNVVVKKNGTVNLSLTNAKSTWDGVAYNNGGTVNLWLQNGAIWTNDKWGDQTGFNGSHITKLTGGAGGAEGYITMNDTNILTIDKISGATKVFYAHINDGDELGDYAAGDIKITASDAGAAITLITYNTGITMTDDKAVENALNTLAGKLYYLNYTTGEDNLTGYVQIAEGLTSSSAMLKEGFIAFDGSTGKGSYEVMGYKTAQTKFSLTDLITGSADLDKKFIRVGILREDERYHFDKDTTINLNASGTEYRGITNTGDVVIEAADKDITLNVTGDATTLYGIKQDGTEKSITVKAKNLNINAEGEQRVEGINLYNTDINNASTMNIDGNVNIYAHAGASALMGIHAVANSYLNITGDLNIKDPNTEDGKWGTNGYGTNGKTIGNTYFGNAAVYVHSGMGACQKSGGVNITGDVNIVAGGHGLYINGGGGVINISGGGYIENDPTIYVTGSVGGMTGGETSYSAMRSELGYIYMNVVKDSADGVKGNVTGAGNKKVTILGNLAVTCGADNSSLDPNHYESFINLGLNTSDSSWKGVAYNSYTNTTTGAVPFRGEINLWLANGATWTNEKYGRIGENPYAGLKFSGNEGDKAVYDGSRINKLVGGSSADNSGIIFQNDTNPLTIDNYSGNTKVFYAHENDGDEASDYAAGDITIKAAAEGSVITLITNNEGIASVGKADATLNALAGKLIYAAYADGEKNLTGKVEIAEGLTSSSASLRLGKIDFDAENGKGKLYNPYKDEQEVFEFTAPILGNPETDIAYIEGGVLRKNGIYTFDGDTTIDSAGASVEKGLYGSAGTAIIDASSVNQHTVLDLQGHNLNVKGTTANGLIDIMATGVVDTNTKQLNIGTVEINNPGQIVLEASRTGASGYPTPVYVNGGGKIVIHNGEGDLDSKVVTIKSETPNNDQFCGIKTMNGVKDGRSQVIIDGLVDIETSAYRENPGTNIEGISNVASTVSVGGGTIKLTNEDENGRKGNGIWAIRSYGEFTSSNPGYVYFNAVHEGVEGAATGSGENKAVIEGDVGMSGSMNVIGSINVGFGTEDSYFKGNVRSTGSYGAAQGNGAVNLWFTPGSYWEGDNISAGHDTNVYLDSASWTGKSTQGSGTTKAGAPIGFNLDMKNGSVWNNTGDSLLLSLSGSGSAINMANAGAGNVTIDNYSGNTKVFYAHENDGDEASDYAAGDITIKAAAEGSVITLITNNSGITDVNKADATLNALANKLIYLAYVNGENNLQGKVEIAEGLTSSSASLRIGDMGFEAETGKGKYEVPATKATQVITGDITVDTAYTDVYADGVYTIPVSAEIAGIDAKQDMIVVSAGNNKRKAAKITKQVASGDAIGVANKGNAEIRHAKARGTDKFVAVVDVKSDAGNAYGIYSDGTSNDKQAKLNYNYHDEDFDYDAKGTAIYIITAEGADKSFGVYSAGNSKIELYQVNIGSDGAYTLKENDNGLINSTGLYAGKGSVLAKGGEIVVDGDLNIYVNGNGAFVNGGNAQISTYGGGEIAVNKDNTHGYVALGASGGKINLYNINTHSAMGYKGGIYNIKGNLMVSTLAADGTDAGTETEINLDLVTGLESSTAHEWTGVAYNAFADNGLKVGEKTYTGAINLWLDKKSTWNNELWGMTAKAGANDIAFSGSHIANLTGGNSSSEPGNIFQKDTNPLTVDKLTGAVKIYYAHEEAAPTKFNAGDTIIRSANESAVVIMATDHTGITTSDDAAVNAVLNALANKLYYTGYVTGERNLSGAVQILEGLTSSSVTLKTGDIVFAESGQGALDGYTPEPPPPTGMQTVFDYTVGIANTKMDDKPYVDGGVRQSDGTYKMEGNTTIALKDVSVADTAIMNSNGNDLTINAGNNELKTSIDGTKQIYGILQKDNNQIDITASKFVVDVTSTGRTEAISVTNTDADKKAVININADTYLTANAGSGAAMGIHATGNSEVNINGNLTMKGDGEHPWGVALEKGGYSYFGAAALYSHNSYGALQKSGDINVNGLVDIEAYANGAYVNGGGGTINIAGGSIKMNKDDTAKGYAALRAESGHINMNMNADNSAAGTNKVNILGNVDTTAGAYNLTLEPCEESVVNLGMSTEDSTWTGVAYNAFPDDGMGGTAGSGTWKGQERNFTGAINLWLGNGATWNNELYGITETAYMGKNFEGSHLAKLTGGNSAANAGIIFQKDANPLTIDAYSGNTKVFYAHNNDGDEATDYAAGDITIKAAATGSVITLITDKTGISDVAKANDTLNALANKLTYAAYANGEKNLSGKVEIAEGLTSSSISLRLEDMTFDEETGKGKYEAAEPSEKQTVFDYDAAIDNNEADDQEYVDGGVRRADGTYKMEGNTTIALKDVAVANSYIMNSNKNDLTINAGNNELKTSIDGTKQIYGILQNDNNQIDITASKFVVDVTSTGRTEAISVTNTDADKKAVININADTYLTSNAGSSAAIGIHATGNSEVNINGNLTMKGDGKHPWGVSLANGGYSYFGGAALYSHNSYGALQKSGDINVNGLVDIEAYANGAYVNGGGGTINIAGGSIKMNKEDTAKGYAALRAESGHINMNMNADNSAAGTKKVNILGNVDTTAGAYNLTLEPCEESVVNLGMATNDSTWTGVAYNAFPDEGLGGTATSGTWKGEERKFTGAINVWLQNGATWTNEKYGTVEKPYAGLKFDDYGSRLAKLAGGDSDAKAGIIYQKDSHPITIDEYSGNTKVFYEHTNDGDEATDYAAGDIKIKSAASGSVITLITNSEGIASVGKADATLNALAGKLIYSAYADGEENLSGKVEIAEGLTSSSKSMRLEDIAFNETTGRGGYKGIVVDPTDPTDPTTPGGDDPEPVEKPAVYNGGLFINEGDNMVINKNVEATCYSDSYSAAGIGMMIGGSGAGKETHLTVNGKVTMGSEDNPGVVAEDKHGAYDFYAGTRWTGAGINMNQGHGSTITITKGLEIYADCHGIVTDPYYPDKKYADKKLAVVTVNGPTTIHVGSDEDVGLYALANYGGTININMKNGQPGTDKVDIFGNAIVMKDTIGEAKNPYFYRSGEINLALTTADSLWTGAVDNTGTTQAGDFNLYLQNGGTWDYQNASVMNGLSASTMPTPSNGFYGSYDDISHVANLTGGDSEANRGVIKVNSDDTLAIANYSGNVLVAYEHDEVNPTTIYGGNIKVAKAKVGSVITLFTDKKGVDGSNYTAVLNALAGKLYYTGGDEALIGQVQIGEGLTSQSMTYEGYIAYGANGQGKYTKEKGTTVVDTPIGEGTSEGAFKVEVTDDGTKIIKMDERPKMVSVATGSALKNSGVKPLIIDNPQATLVLQSADKTSPVVAADKGDVKINGTVEVIGVPGQKLMEVAAGKKMDLAGGEFTAVGANALELAEGATVNLGMPVESAQPGAPAPKPLPVKLTGDIQNTQGTLNLNLGTADSFWKGDYQNKDAELNLTIDNKDAKWEGKVKGETLNVNLNAGTWVNKGKSYSTSGKFTLKAGGVKKAFIDMRQGSDNNITIDNYSGGMTLMYSNDESMPTTINGGDVTIKSAAENSVVNLWTDGKGLDLTTEVGVDTAKDTAVKEVLSALARKLTYDNYADGHITGEVGVGEALTRPAVTFPKAAELVFKTEDAGKGSIDASTFKDNIPHGEVVYGDSETAMMRGAKMAMASTAMIWRAEGNDLTKRMGDLQLRKEEAGVWAKYYSGRQEYNNNGSFSNKYKAVQFGVDKTLGHGWLGGIALSYDDGKGSLNNGGRADNKVQSLGFYGTKVNKNGEYIDLIGKFSRLENEYTVYNDYGYSLDGDYKNFGMSVSAEYGKHINLKNGLVLTPAVEFTLGRVNSKNYDAYSEYYEKSMTVKQDAFNSAIGRIGISLGKETGAYSYYAKLGLAHEFAGGFDTTYSAPGEPTSSTSVDFKDTWGELQLGGSVKLKNDALLYGSFSKSFGGDVREKWRIDAGMMFTFNHLSDFFGGKKALTNIAVPVADEVTTTANLTEGTVENNVNVESAVIAGTEVQDASVTVGEEVAPVAVKPVKNAKGTYVLDECIVTANRTKQRITDATADVSVVTRAEIEEMNMTTVEEALRTVPGIQFLNYGGGNQLNGNISGLRINGSNDIVVLVDGVKISDARGVGTSGNMYASVLNNMNNIERIEVMRGAAGVLYGSNAKGGVINIITREINENQTIIDGSMGSFGMRDTKFNTMGRAGKLTYNIYQGTYKQGDVTDGDGLKWEGHTDTHNFGGKITYEFNDSNKLTLDYMDIKSEYSGYDFVYSDHYDGKYESKMISIRDDWKINKHLDNTLVYRYNDSKSIYNEIYEGGVREEIRPEEYEYTFINEQLHFNSSRHDLIAGFEYSNTKDKNSQHWEFANITGRPEIKSKSFFINEEWTIIPHVKLSGGIRHDSLSSNMTDYNSHDSKSYKLSWDISKNDTLYAGRSEYYIVPSADEWFNKKWGNSLLKPSEGYTESIGYNKKFDDNNFLTVNWYQTKEEVGYGYNTVSKQYENTANGVSRGWNAQFSSRLSDKWNFNLGWSHLFEHSGGDDSFTYGFYPRDKANFAVYYNVGKFSAGLDGYYFFRKVDENREKKAGVKGFPADNYAIFNLSLNYKPTSNIKAYFKVNNLFDKYYAERTDAFWNPNKEHLYYAMPGRAFMVGLEFKF